MKHALQEDEEFYRAFMGTEDFPCFAPLPKLTTLDEYDAAIAEWENIEPPDYESNYEEYKWVRENIQRLQEEKRWLWKQIKKEKKRGRKKEETGIADANIMAQEVMAV